MNVRPQQTKSLQVVNLSEGWGPAVRRQGAQHLQVVNLSEGWGLAWRPQGKEPLQVVNLSEGCKWWGVDNFGGIIGIY